MKFLIDNALSPKFADHLNQQGHDAVYVRSYDMASADDEAVLDRAALENRVLNSADTDFGRILSERKSNKPSVILFRWPLLRQPYEQARVLLSNLPRLLDALDEGSIVVIEESRLRVRSLPIIGRDD